MERVWKVRCVRDEVLTVAIYALRKALGDDARRPQYIETVSRRGYRWIAPVAPVAIPPATPRPRRYSWPTVAATATVSLALLAAAAMWTLTVAHRTRHVTPAEVRQADAKGRYFLDQRSIGGWRQALDQFERAAALDSQDPAAHAGLADT